MKELLEFIVKALVAKPESVKIEEETQSGNFIIFADENDKGLIIGKKGKIIKAIRTLLRAASGQARLDSARQVDKQFFLKIA